MTRRTNLLTLRKYFAWRSVWFQTDSYQGLVVRDLVINTFLSGICRRLGIVSSHFAIRSTIFNINVIDSELFFFDKRKMLPLCLINSSFLRPFKLLVQTFKTTVHSPSDSIYGAYQTAFFVDKLLRLQTYTVFFTAQYLHINPTHTFDIYSCFTKSNILHTSHQSIVSYIYNKHQFNLFFCFTDSISRFNTLKRFSELGQPHCRFMRFATKSSEFVVAQSNIFNRYHNTGAFSKFRRVRAHTFRNIVPKSTAAHTRKTYDSISISSSAAHIIPARIADSYSLLFVLYTYFNIEHSGTSISHIKYSYILSKLFSCTLHADIQYSFDFFANLYTAGQAITSRNTTLFSYWLLKYMWLSFFNASFITLSEDMTGPLTEVYESINSMYHLIFIRYEHAKYTFFYETLYISTFRQFTTLLCTDMESAIQIMFLRSAIQWLVSSIELSLCSYAGSTFFFIPRFFLETPPFITNSKIVCEYLKLCMLNGLTVSRAFRKVSRWHRSQRRYLKRRLPTFKSLRPDLLSQVYKSSLKGIRIICSGPPYKARRKMRRRYHLWLAREFISGNMPLQSFKYNIDYFQSYVRLKRSSIGIKVWTLFEKHEDKVFW